MKKHGFFGSVPVNPVSLRSLRSFAAKTSELESMNLPQRNAESTKINGATDSGQPGDAAGNTELAESPCGFVLEGVVGERVTRQECPEIWWGKLKIEIDMNADEERRRKGGGGRGGGVKAVEDDRSPSPGGITEPGRAQPGEGKMGRKMEGTKMKISSVSFRHASFYRSAESDVGRKIPECRGDFILHDVGGEWLMPQECPGFRGGAARVFELPRRSAKDTKDEERVRFVSCGRSDSGGKILGQTIEMWGSPELPECGGDFILHDVGGEWLMPQECPGFRGGAARVFGLPRRSAKSTKDEERVRFVSCGRSDSGGKILGQECPEIGGNAEG